MNNTLDAYTILYVEDNHAISEETVFFLEPLVKGLYHGDNGLKGIELFEQHKPDIIITDIQMPKMNGLDMISKIRETDRETPVIVTTAFNESDYLVKAINLHVDAYVMKPLNLKELIKTIHKVIEPIELKRELVNKNRQLQEINENLDAIAQEKTKKLEYLYNHDPLTGLSNFLQLGQEIEGGDYNHLILLDVSDFSMINKQYGKNFANAILQEASKILKKHINNNTRLFKTESDRFVFLIKETQIDKVEEFCQQLISYFDVQPLEVDSLEITINFTIGIAQIVGEEYPLVNAEYALELGKKLGSRYYHFYDDSMESVQIEKEKIKWINVTKELIKSDKIEPYYQPITDIRSGKVEKYEVLARGEYDGQLLSPYFFISSAERLGLIGSVTRIIINKCFNTFQSTDVKLSINITQRDLIDKYLISFLRQKLEKYKIDPRNITFEILENVTIGEQHELVISQLRELKRMGFEIAIDDFGIENSNFSRLLEIDFDYLKIDGLFIQGLQNSPKDRIIVSAIVSLAKTLGIKTIAEYVENQELYQIVSKCGVDMAQGYHVGKPEATI